MKVNKRGVSCSLNRLIYIRLFLKPVISKFTCLILYTLKIDIIDKPISKDTYLTRLNSIILWYNRLITSNFFNLINLDRENSIEITEERQQSNTESIKLTYLTTQETNLLSYLTTINIPILSKLPLLNIWIRVLGILKSLFFNLKFAFTKRNIYKAVMIYGFKM